MQAWFGQGSNSKGQVSFSRPDKKRPPTKRRRFWSKNQTGKKVHWVEAKSFLTLNTHVDLGKISKLSISHVVDKKTISVNSNFKALVDRREEVQGEGEKRVERFSSRINPREGQVMGRGQVWHSPGLRFGGKICKIWANCAHRYPSFSFSVRPVCCFGGVLLIVLLGLGLLLLSLRLLQMVVEASVPIIIDVFIETYVVWVVFAVAVIPDVWALAFLS